MKKKLLLIILPLLLGAGGCSRVNDTHSSINVIDPNEYRALNERLMNDLGENQVLLNLTKYGLYNNKKGNSSSDYYLENYVILDLAVGENLPSSEITSSLSTSKFSSWCYAGDEANLLFTDKVISGQKYYQAYFTYVEGGTPVSSSSSSSSVSSSESSEEVSSSSSEELSSEVVSSSSTEELSSELISSSSVEITSSESSSESSVSSYEEVDPTTRKIYFAADSNWMADNPDVYSYYWEDKGAEPVIWPGEKLSPTTEVTIENYTVFAVEIDLNINRIIFSRVEPGTATAWNQTEDLIIPTDKNLATISSSWGSEGKCKVTWSNI